MKSDPYAGKVKFYETIIDRLNQPIHAIAYKMVPAESGATVLDIGCGTGAQLARYVSAGCQVSGVDLSPAMLAAAGARLGPEVDLQLADATSLPFVENQFDVVTCSMFLHELDPELRDLVLAEVERVLKQDGRGVIVEFDATARKGVMAKLRRAMSSFIERLAGSNHYRNFRQFIRAGGVTAAVEAHGLHVHEVRTFPDGDLAIYVVARDAR